jgi:GT2 family glycosyltransferase
MDLSIVIVNWNSLALLRKCLTSVYGNTSGIKFEVIVVDNASFDGSREAISAEHAQAHFIQSEENLGFAGANNLGAACAQGDLVIFLNPDTEVRGNALAEMASVFRTRPDAGAVGCRLLNSDGTLQSSCVQPFPTILNQVLLAEGMLRVAARVGVRGLWPLYAPGPGVFPAEALSGACLMVKRDAFREIGGFSRDYYMYTEDIDLCYRLRRAGLVNYYVNTAVVVHHGGGSSRQRKEQCYADVQIRESVFKFLRRTRGGLYANAYRAAMFFASIARVGVLSMLLLAPLRPKGRSPLRLSLVKWTSILRWSLQQQRWTR